MPKKKSKAVRESKAKAQAQADTGGKGKGKGKKKTRGVANNSNNEEKKNSAPVKFWKRLTIPVTVHTPKPTKGKEVKPLCELIFSNLDDMDRILAPISDAIEGTVNRRTGHNFSFESYLAVAPPSFAQFTRQLKAVGTRYIMAHLEGDLLTKRHELRHAMFYLDDDYKHATTEAWEDLTKDDQARVTRLLTSIGYDEKVHIDEFQAYQFTEKKSLFGLRDPPANSADDQRDKDWMAGNYSTRWEAQY